MGNVHAARHLYVVPADVSSLRCHRCGDTVVDQEACFVRPTIGPFRNDPEHHVLVHAFPCKEMMVKPPFLWAVVDSQ